jgi:hypothetical protein
MFSASGINLTTLIKRYPPISSFNPTLRLEAATSRLEDLAVANTNDFRQAHAHRNSATSSLSKETSPQFNTGVFTPEGQASVAQESVAPEEKPPVILDYEKIIKDNVDPWAAKGEKIGEVVGEQVFLLMGC